MRASLGGGIFGGVCWMVVMAAQAGDWLSLVLISLVVVGLYLWSTRKVLAEGAAVARRVLLIVLGVVMLTTTVAANLRFNDWLVAAARLYTDAQVTSMPLVPLWQLNLMLAIIAAFIAGPILVTQDFGQPKKMSK